MEMKLVAGEVFIGPVRL